MLLSVILALCFYCMGASSAPRPPCPTTPCKQAISAIIDHLNGSKLTRWRTRAMNVTDANLVNCNLEIIKEDFNSRCNETCKTDVHRALLYKGLECIPHNCKVPDTVCSAPPNTRNRNFANALKDLVTTIQRNQI